MSKAAEYRSALASLEAMGPTLQRILKAAAAGAAILDTLEEQQHTLERNIHGLKEREGRSIETARQAKDDATRVVKESEDAIERAHQREAAAGAKALEVEQRLKGLTADAQQAQRHLAELEAVIKEHEARAQKQQERADRIAAAVTEAARP